MYKEIAKKLIEEGYSFAGVRSLTDDENYEIGDICRESYGWNFEEDCSTYYTTQETAGGTCATSILGLSEMSKYNFDEDDINAIAKAIETAVSKNGVYDGDKQVIIAGHRQDLDHDLSDDDEIRIINAEVIAYV